MTPSLPLLHLDIYVNSYAKKFVQIQLVSKYVDRLHRPVFQPSIISIPQKKLEISININKSIIKI